MERSESSEPTVDEILAEVERRRAARTAPNHEEGDETAQLSPTARRLVIAADRVIFWLSSHWLAIFNLAALLYVGLPFLAPVLMYAGLNGPGRILYAVYGPLCHQLPYRSWYLFGPQATYTVDELARLVGPQALVQHGYIGDPTLGYKVALCQRDTAIYGTILLAGLAYGLTRRRIKPMPLWAYALLGILPIGLDGGLQFLSHALQLLMPQLGLPRIESTPLRRVITGSLFGLSTAWLAYPNVQEAADEFMETLEQRFGWKRGNKEDSQ